MPAAPDPRAALQWDDLRLTLAICEIGTLSGAAAQLGISHPTLSRRLQTIERRLGTRLFERTPNRLRPTDAGEEMRRLALPLREAIGDLERRIAGRDTGSHGPVRLTAPDAVAEYLLPPLLAALCQRHAGLTIDLLVSNQVLSLAQRAADIALRVTDQPPDTLRGRRVGTVAMAVYASRALAPEAAAPAAWAGLPWVGFDAALACSGPGAWLARHVPEHRLRLRANTLLGAAQAVRQGIGCGVLPCFVGAALPELVRVGEPLCELAQPLWLLVHADQARLPRIRRATDALAEQLQQAAPRLAGLA
ncbi:LysR family transcriptional regulator [Aquabacterium sp. OR-4]|uniref:LysR family transcriptional regulator n=1 Tax=Aquabacterium sp. OR-4 TaxID=2978127 RepID=UPI0021B1EE43|nr:LysR family transcriptional regulator [Aquabacterium sp. OR-4]MDT7837865.1 LysR family transcriptional regulator [Aquabacterium sp. OR-4]